MHIMKCKEMDMPNYKSLLIFKLLHMKAKPSMCSRSEAPQVLVCGSAVQQRELVTGLGPCVCNTYQQWLGCAPKFSNHILNSSRSPECFIPSHLSLSSSLAPHPGWNVPPTTLPTSLESDSQPPSPACEQCKHRHMSVRQLP